MQGKSKYYFPNHLLFAALANILGRANPNIIFPPILRVSGVFGFYIKNPSLGWGNFISIFHAFYFQRKR